MNKKVYIAGPLFSQAELDFNLKLNAFLIDNGYSTFLPQKDGFRLSDLAMCTDPDEASSRIFQFDLEQIRRSEVLVMILDGRVPDEGACVEAGIAFSLGKECYGLKTDCRCLMNFQDNPLITGVLKRRIAHTFEELIDLIR